MDATLEFRRGLTYLAKKASLTAKRRESLEPGERVILVSLQLRLIATDNSPSYSRLSTRPPLVC